MITNKEIYGLHTSVDSEPSELYEAYRDVPLDSLDESRKNNTPLHTACYFGDMTAVGILLERGADPNVKNDDGDTPLCVMARRGPRPDDADIAGLLLSKGARVPPFRQRHDRPHRSRAQPQFPDGRCPSDDGEPH